MNEIYTLNPLLEAMNDIDDAIVSEAAPVERKRPKYFKPMMIAAAAAVAAAVSLLVGFTVATRQGEFRIGNKPAFEFNLAHFDLTIPDEYKPCEENMYTYRGKVDVGVEELFEMFNAPLLINDNFSTEVDKAHVEKWTYSNLTTGEEYEISFEPWIEVFSSDVEFHYYLYDKNLNRNVLFEALYLTEQCGPEFAVRSGVSGKIDGYEIITLNDGSKCFVDGHGADFAYKGVRYQMFTLNPDEPSIDITKQVLQDLGVL